MKAVSALPVAAAMAAVVAALEREDCVESPPPTQRVDDERAGDREFHRQRHARGRRHQPEHTVNILDFSLLKINWFTLNSVADINGDGMTSLPDYLIMSGNWYKAGDPR